MKAKNLRDEFAMSSLIALYSSPRIVDRAIDGWVESGGPRPTCIAEFMVGLAFEMADEAMKERARTPHERELFAANGCTARPPRPKASKRKGGKR